MQAGSHKSLGHLQLGFARHTFLESKSQKGTRNPGGILTPRAYRSQPQESTGVWETFDDSYQARGRVTKEESLLLSILKALSPSKTPWNRAPGGYLHPQPRTFSWAKAPTPFLWMQQQQQLHRGPSRRGVVSSCVMPYTDGNGNRKVGHLDPNLYQDWEPRFKHMSAVTASLPAGHRWHWWWMSTFLWQLCHWGARHPGFGVSETTI